MLKQTQAIFYFYKGFFLLPLLATLGNAILIYKFGITEFLLLILFTKVGVNWLVWYFYQLFWKEEFYFYHNFHLSEKQLWWGAFSIDFSLMYLLFTIANYLK